MLMPLTQRGRQRGMVMLFTLIILVAMTLASIALVRSTMMSNIVAGNMAFQQAATRSADTAIEAAIFWLEANHAGTTLWNTQPVAHSGYNPMRTDPATGQTWDAYWGTLLTTDATAVTSSADAAGNVYSYVIQRLCGATGDPSITSANCVKSPTSISKLGNSQSDQPVLNAPSQVYYRITARVSGPRNTVSYVQAVVAL